VPAMLEHDRNPPLIMKLGRNHWASSFSRSPMDLAPAVTMNHERDWNAPKCDSHHILMATDVKSS
jgi:hypothetical protein